MEYYFDPEIIARAIAEHIQMGFPVKEAIIFALLSIPPWRDAIYEGIKRGEKSDNRRL